VIGDILQPTHLLFILVVALLVLGPKRLPEVGRSLGRGLRDFRSALSGEDRDEVPAQTEPAHQFPPAPAPPVPPVQQPEATTPAGSPEPIEHVAQPEHVEQPEHTEQPEHVA
jgi:sec-independent protein translocase protein TatA